jgi:hypothetical protein
MPFIKKKLKADLSNRMRAIIQRRTFFSYSLLSKNIQIMKHRAVILSLYGCEAWSLILRDKHKLRVFEKMVLKKIFRPKRD